MQPPGNVVRAALFAGGLVMLIACGSSKPAHVNVIGPPEELAPLTGEWTGTYESRATGRSGSITFHLTDDPKGAHGDVLLTPRREVVTEPGDERHQPFAGGGVLSIEFVRISQGEISGRIAPYPDPDVKGATLETHFAGHLDGEWIGGSFVTYSDRGDSPRRGTWRARRKKTA